MTATLALKEIDDTALATLESEGRLLNPLTQGPHQQTWPCRVSWRIGLAFLPPSWLTKPARRKLLCQQAMAIANVGEKHIPFFAG